MPRKRPPASLTRANVPYRSSEKENAQLEAYYSRLFGRVECKALLQQLRAPLPQVIRLNAASAQASLLERVCSSICACAGKTANERAVAAGRDGKMSGACRQLDWLSPSCVFEFRDFKLQDAETEVAALVPGGNLRDFVILEDARGTLVRQEKVSMYPPFFLQLQQGNLVLDMCAAPGSKTTQILDIFHRLPVMDQAVIGGVVANDVSTQRTAVLEHQLQRRCLPNFTVTTYDAANFPIYSDPYTGEKLLFDRVLADVPCSGDGIMRKSADSWRRWSAKAALSLHRKQIAIATRGLELLKVGGLMVYSTCSMNPIENEAVVATLLRRFAGEQVVLEDAAGSLHVHKRNGLTTWEVVDPRAKEDEASLGAAVEPRFYSAIADVPEDLIMQKVLCESMFPPAADPYVQNQLLRCIRIHPSDADSSGFFLAVFRRGAAISPPQQADSTQSVTTVSLKVTNNPQPKRAKRNSPPKGFVTCDNIITASVMSDLLTFFGMTPGGSQDSLSIVSAIVDPSDTVKVSRLDFRHYLEHSTGVLRIQTVGKGGSCASRDLHLPASGMRPWEVRQWKLASDNVDTKLFFVKANAPRKIYVTTAGIAAIAEKYGSLNTWTCLGLRAFQAFDSKQRERYNGTGWRIAQEAIMTLLKYIRRRIIFMSRELGYSLLTGPKKLSGHQLLRGEAYGQVANLDSCRSNDDTQQGGTSIVAGSVIVVFMPHYIMPPEGYFPDAEFSSEANDGLLSPPEFLQLSLSEHLGMFGAAVPLACLLTKSGSLAPFAPSESVNGALAQMYGVVSS